MPRFRAPRDGASSPSRAQRFGEYDENVSSPVSCNHGHEVITDGSDMLLDPLAVPARGGNDFLLNADVDSSSNPGCSSSRSGSRGFARDERRAEWKRGAGR